MARLRITSPPIAARFFDDDDQFPEDTEYFRKRIPGTNRRYRTIDAEGFQGHCAYDFQASDLRCLAACDGVVKHVDFGEALGENQFVIRARNGAGAYYAHTNSRLADGTRVRAGDFVARVGDSSSFDIGIHLHFTALGRWNDSGSIYNCGPDLRDLLEDTIMAQFTEEERKVLRALVKAINEAGTTPAGLVKNTTKVIRAVTPAKAEELGRWVDQVKAKRSNATWVGAAIDHVRRA